MPTPPSTFQTTLSHTEFAYLLKQLGASLSVGVDRNPLDELSDGERELAHTIARDALRARGLVRLDAELNPLIQNQLLEILQIYATPYQIVTAYRYTADDELPAAFFGYRHNGQSVTHTRPDDLLHELTLYDGALGLLSSLIAFCAAGQTATAPRQLALSLPGIAVAAARHHADNGQTLEIVRVLSDASVPVATATMLAADLVSPSALTAITFFSFPKKGDILRRECIYWQSKANQTALIILYRGGGEQTEEQVLVSDGNEESALSIFNQMVQ